jgi:hypothetical protein
MSDASGSDLVTSGVIVVELDDVVPRRHPDLPNLYVASTSSPIRVRFEQLQRGKGPAWIQGHVVRLRSALSVDTRPLEPARARAIRRETVQNLQSKGFTVNCDTYTWCVYVIELDPAAVKDPGLGVVYVGETSLTPEERFKQHKSKARGAKNRRLASPVVAKYGKTLRMDLAPVGKLYDKQTAKRAEAEWAEHLRSLGYVVKGGH